MSWNLAEIGELMAIVSMVNAATIWVLKRLLDNQRAYLTAQVRQLTERDEAHDDSLADLRVEVAKNYIHRDDAIVYFGRFEQKIDSIWSHLITQAQTGGHNGS